MRLKLLVMLLPKDLRRAGSSRAFICVDQCPLTILQLQVEALVQMPRSPRQVHKRHRGQKGRPLIVLTAQKLTAEVECAVGMRAGISAT